MILTSTRIEILKYSLLCAATVFSMLAVLCGGGYLIWDLFQYDLYDPFWIIMFGVFMFSGFVAIFGILINMDHWWEG